MSSPNCTYLVCQGGDGQSEGHLSGIIGSTEIGRWSTVISKLSVSGLAVIRQLDLVLINTGRPRRSYFPESRFGATIRPFVHANLALRVRDNQPGIASQARSRSELIHLARFMWREIRGSCLLGPFPPVPPFAPISHAPGTAPGEPRTPV